MKIRLIVVALLTVLAIASGLQAQGGKKSSELTDVMENMGAPWRKARSQVTDAAKNADTIARFTALKRGMEAALKLEPEMKATLPPAEQPKFIAAYQAELKEQIERIDEIVALLKAGKNKEAAALTEAIEDDRKAAHQQFRKPKEKKESK